MKGVTGTKRDWKWQNEYWNLVIHMLEKYSHNLGKVI